MARKQPAKKAAVRRAPTPVPRPGRAGAAGPAPAPPAFAAAPPSLSLPPPEPPQPATVLASGAESAPAASPPPLQPPPPASFAGGFSPPPPPARPVLLEDAIIALQKTFSRVNAATQENREKKPGLPTALIVGDVQFELSVTLAPAEPLGMQAVDALRVDAAGPIKTTLKGTINTDVRAQAVGSTSDSNA